jgi:hypothetical protein
MSTATPDGRARPGDKPAESLPGKETPLETTTSTISSIQSTTTPSKSPRRGPGNKETAPIPRTLTPPYRPIPVLADASIEAFASHILAKGCRRIIVMTGAGISTSCGIPDFRSPGTGLYANLSKYNLPYPEGMCRCFAFDCPATLSHSQIPRYSRV